MLASVFLLGIKFVTLSVHQETFRLGIFDLEQLLRVNSKGRANARNPFAIFQAVSQKSFTPRLFTTNIAPRRTKWPTIHLQVREFLLETENNVVANGHLAWPLADEALSAQILDIVQQAGDISLPIVTLSQTY